PVHRLHVERLRDPGPALVVLRAGPPARSVPLPALRPVADPRVRGREDAAVTLDRRADRRHAGRGRAHDRGEHGGVADLAASRGLGAARPDAAGGLRFEPPPPTRPPPTAIASGTSPPRARSPATRSRAAHAPAATPPATTARRPVARMR